MKKIRNPIIPITQRYYTKTDVRKIDYKAICYFAAIGFFLDDDTFWTNKKVMKPFTEYQLDDLGNIENSNAYFSWHYSPRNVSFDDVVDEFSEIMNSLVEENLAGRKVILPLSGGLDSRSQATSIKGWENIYTYSYKFHNSFNETSYGKAISKENDWRFDDLTVPEGYLWNNIKDLASINECYSEFTHPRQMAFVDKYKPMGNIFYLGHWGDVLFDDMGVSEDMDFRDLVQYLKKKVIKKGGLELGSALWLAWGLSGDFEKELTQKLESLLEDIKIENNNARIRAFKSTYWAPRWTSINLNVFKSVHDVYLPYYDERMCHFICTVPEEYLAGRKIQIEYIKRFSPELAMIPWQEYAPLNLNNYNNYFSLSRIPNRVFRKLKREAKSIYAGQKVITRNWELQFEGDNNDKKLRDWLFSNEKFSEFIPKELVESFYAKFKDEDSVYYSHSISMLLTLSLFTLKGYK